MLIFLSVYSMQRNPFFQVLNLKLYVLLVGSIILTEVAIAQIYELDKAMHHIRKGKTREWNDFPLDARDSLFVTHFHMGDASWPGTISLRQYDINGVWEVLLNGNSIGNLTLDEKDMISYFEFASGALKQGDNILEVRSKRERNQENQTSDDILIGQITLFKRPLKQILSEVSIQVEIAEKNSDRLLPARITIVDRHGSLQPISVPNNQPLAVRTGVIYTGNGRARFNLPAGQYKIYASRGFEYDADSFRINADRGALVQKRLTISHSVDIRGWISCDPHIHSLTYSGHGDATMEERILTIAGEGIELPVITEHNIAVDIKAESQKMGMNEWFSPVTGDEVTTAIGHFNIFPINPGSSIPDYHVRDWKELEKNLDKFKEVKVIVLNHAQDIHDGFRPFDPKNHNAVAGKMLNDWAFPANAMEVMNSGSQQPDPLQLCHDWMAMMNRGFLLSPVGSSDAHEVSRYMVGQARTYIKVSKKENLAIDTEEAIRNFAMGKVSVSFGLMTELIVDSTYGSGEMVTSGDKIRVSIKVMGPAWTQADQITLYANGQKIREAFIPKKAGGGIKWQGNWLLPKPGHDLILVAVARGPGVHIPYWPIVRPFEHKSSIFHPLVVGISGAVRIDADANGHFTSAYEYAKSLWDSSKGNLPFFITELGNYDESVAIQAAAVIVENGMDLNSQDLAKALSGAPSKVRNGFRRFTREWELSKKSRVDHEPE